jgi:hypothetical protein
MLRFRERRAHRAEVLLAVDEEGDLRRALDPPAVSAGNEKGRAGTRAIVARRSRLSPYCRPDGGQIDPSPDRGA